MDFHADEKPFVPNQNLFYGSNPNPYNPQDPYNPQGGYAPVPPSQPTPPPPPPANYGPYGPAGTTGSTPTVYTHQNLPVTPLPDSSRYEGPTRPPHPPTISKKMLLVVLAAIIVLLGSALAIFIPYHNAQVDSANATATSQANATSVARAAATARVVAITATAQVHATATAIVAADPYSPHTGTLAVVDSLNAANNSLPNSGGCTFTNGAYQVSVAKGYTHACTGGSSFSDFTFEVHMTILQGDCGGLVFRDNTASNQEYQFEICQDGRYGFYVQEPNSSYKTIQGFTATSGINTGLNKQNTLAVVANGQKIDLYVNQQLVGSFNDTSSSQGWLGFLADGETSATAVAYANERVWTL